VRRRIKKVGNILHPSPIAPNIVIAKVSEYLDPGVVVYDDDLKRIGTVIEVFGPVNSPYARIRIDKEIKRDELTGKRLFVITGEKKRVIWKKMPGYKRLKKTKFSIKKFKGESSDE